jgi:hypothetical protein
VAGHLKLVYASSVTFVQSFILKSPCGLARTVRRRTRFVGPAAPAKIGRITLKAGLDIDFGHANRVGSTRSMIAHQDLVGLTNIERRGTDCVGSVVGLGHITGSGRQRRKGDGSVGGLASVLRHGRVNDAEQRNDNRGESHGILFCRATSVGIIESATIYGGRRQPFCFRKSRV